MKKYVIPGVVFAVEVLMLQTLQMLNTAGIINFVIDTFPWNGLCIGAFILPLEIIFYFLAKDQRIKPSVRKVFQIVFWIIIGIFCFVNLTEVIF